MADIKISQLGAAVAVADADVIPATANGVTVKVPASVLKEYAIGGTDISSIGDGTPTGAISALKSVKIEKTDIAPIETSVASKAYAVGDQLYYNGMLYSVIAAIAQGETLVVDTNIELSDKVTEQIKALNGEVSTLNSNLTNAANRGTGKRIIVFSDSYGVTVGGETPFTTILQSKLSGTPVTYEYFAIGSLGITPNSARPEGLSQYLDEHWYSSITTPETVSDIIVAMGANDIPNVAQLPSYFVTLCANLKAKFKGAKIWFAFIGQSYNVTISQRNTAIKAYINNAKINGCYYMDGAQYIMADGTNLQSDNVHPNTQGAGFIADMIIENLMNNSYHYRHRFLSTFKMDDSATYTYQLNITIIDDIVDAYINESQRYAEENYQFTSAFKTGTFTTPPFRGDGSLVINTVIEDVNGAHAMIITINNSKVYVKMAYSNITLTANTSFSGSGTDVLSENN